MENTARTTEPLLREYEQARAITLVKIVNTPEGYVLVVRVSWRKGELVVFNQRGRPRAWMSLDRLLSYLRETLPSITNFELVMEPRFVPGDEVSRVKASTRSRAHTNESAEADAQTIDAGGKPRRKTRADQ